MAFVAGSIWLTATRDLFAPFDLLAEILIHGLGIPYHYADLIAMATFLPVLTFGVLKLQALRT